MKTATVSIRPGKWANVSFALPVIMVPRSGPTCRDGAVAGRWNPCKNRKGIVKDKKKVRGVGAGAAY